MTGVNLKEVAGSYGQVQAEGTAPLFGSSSASCTISPFVSSGCSQTWGHQPRPLPHHSCMWRWEVRKCHRLTQGCIGAEEHREDLLALSCTVRGKPAVAKLLYSPATRNGSTQCKSLPDNIGEDSGPLEKVLGKVWEQAAREGGSKGVLF